MNTYKVGNQYEVTEAWAKVKRENEVWFAPETMEFWGCQLLRDSIHPVGAENFLFITLDDNFDRTAKRFSVREAINGGGIVTHAFQTFRDLDHAMLFRDSLLEEEHKASGISQRW